MKKTILTILLCGFMVLGLTGCGKEINNDSKNDSNNSVDKVETKKEEQTKKTIIGTYETTIQGNYYILEVKDDNTATLLEKTPTDYLAPLENFIWDDQYFKATDSPVEYDGDTVSYKFDGTTLTLYGNPTMVFSKK